MVPAGPEAWKRLPASHKINIDLILVRLYIFSYDFVYVKNNNYICTTCSKTTEVETLNTCNVVYYIQTLFTANFYKHFRQF